MNIIAEILPRFKIVVRMIAEIPDRKDFGFADFPTLISLVILSIVFNRGNRAGVIRHIQAISAFERSHIEFVLNQYEGKHPRHHLWRRNASGTYRLLI